MALSVFSFSLLLHFSLLSFLCFAGEPTVFYELRVSYITASPLRVPQQARSFDFFVIAINDKFPGPLINVTTGNNLVVNVLNDLDEDLLITWPGVQMRRNAWQDGVLGTNCPITPKLNWTYQFQVKDQIGSFFYFPSLNFQRASGGFGPFVLNNREIISIPFAQPDGDIVLIIGDWYTQNHTALRTKLDEGQDLGIPDGVLINGKGPYRYNTTLVPDGIQYETINVDPGKTYRIRVHNVGISASLNFRIQNHNLLLAETEGFYTAQANYTQFDIHVGQSYSFLVSMDQNASSDYYIVASARFVNESLWQRVTGVAILHYSNSKGPAAGPLPDPPNDEYYKEESMNQARSVRQNTSASGARPNPQGSYHYGSINITDTFVLKVLPPATINGKVRAAINGISFVKPEGFIEIVLQNNDTTMQSFHLDGYSAFVVGMAYGNWSQDSRNQYNKWDAISRSSVQVYAGAWTVILVSLDNVGSWNLRADNLDRWYLGQETYLRIVNPEENGDTEMPAPDNVLYCGPLKHLQKTSSNSSMVSFGGHLNFVALMIFFLIFHSM
ncbi:hypothetical protein K1719_023952 [Acacia pycnantha]|nr:hypothetical protein K1719_023952 [Acacia pycnantha]